jgi:hypothetical protein
VRGRLAAGALVAVLLGLAGAAGGEVRRVETVGSVPLPSGAGAPGAREAALREGLAEAVRSIARDLLRASADADPKAVAHALGPLPGPYVLRQRVVEDRGERPALLAADPAVRHEYVVVVEAEVDVDRVRRRLSEAGLSPVSGPGPGAATSTGTITAAAAPSRPAGPGVMPPGEPPGAGPGPSPPTLEPLGAPPGGLLVVLDAASGRVYSALRDGLRADAEVTSVLPVEFAGGRVALSVTTALAPGDLLGRLRTALPDLRIDEVRPPEGRVLVLHAEAAPLPPPEVAPPVPGDPASESPPGSSPAPEKFDTPNPNRY